MQFRGLLIAAGALALLGGLVWWSNKNEATKKPDADPNAPPKIVEITPEKIQKVNITKDGETTTLNRAADNRYELVLPKPLAADSDASSGVFTALTSYVSDRLVEEKAADLKAYGLDSPTLTVAIHQKDGKVVKLLFGDETPTAGSVYVKIEGDPRVFTVASYNKASLDKTWKDLRDKRLLTFDTYHMLFRINSCRRRWPAFGIRSQRVQCDFHDKDARFRLSTGSPGRGAPPCLQEPTTP